MTQTHLHAEAAGHGTDMILLHGWGLNSNVWQQILPDLTRDYRVHAVDLPGFGHSQWRADYSDMRKVSRRLQQYIEIECTAPALMVGWSLGGLVATTLSLERPELVAHLHTVASSPCFVAQGDWPGMQNDVLQQFQHQLDQDFAATLKRFLAVQAMGSPTARDDVKILRRSLLEKPQPHQDALRAGLDWLATKDLRNQLSGLQVPLSRSYGKLDSLVPVRVNTYLNGLLGSETKSVVFEKSAHAPFLNERDAFVAMLKDGLPVNGNTC